MNPKPLRIAYQPVYVDFDVPDGEYTPEELQRARKRLRPDGPVRYYRLSQEGSPEPDDAT